MTTTYFPSGTDTITLTTTGSGSASHTISTGSTIPVNTSYVNAGGYRGGGGGNITLNSGAGLSYTTGAVNWSTPNTNFNDGNLPVMSIPHGEQTVQIEKDATLDVKGKVRINGVDLDERLNTIETVLQIPTRDVTMETKHPKLAKLYKEYMKELEKYKTWGRLNGDEE